MPIDELPLPEPSRLVFEVRIESIRIQAEQRKLSVDDAVELRIDIEDPSKYRKFREMEVRSCDDAERHATCQFRPRASCRAGVLIQEPLDVRQDRQDLTFTGAGDRRL